MEADEELHSQNPGEVREEVSPNAHRNEEDQENSPPAKRARTHEGHEASEGNVDITR